MVWLIFQVKSGWGSGLVASGNKPLHEPMLSKFCESIQYHHYQATMKNIQLKLLSKFKYIHSLNCKDDSMYFIDGLVQDCGTSFDD